MESGGALAERPDGGWIWVHEMPDGERVSYIPQARRLYLDIIHQPNFCSKLLHRDEASTYTYVGLQLRLRQLTYQTSTAL